MPKKCRFCDSHEGVVRIKKRFFACKACQPAVYAVLNKPSVIEKVWPLLYDTAILPQSRRIKIPWRTEIPEELDAVRHRTEDRDNNPWYIVVSEHDSHPIEIFVSSVGENDHKLQGSLVNLTALTRLISLILRHLFLGEMITIEKVKLQLQRSSRFKNDLPDMVLSVLDKYSIKDFSKP